MGRHPGYTERREREGKRVVVIGATTEVEERKEAGVQGSGYGRYIEKKWLGREVASSALLRGGARPSLGILLGLH